MRAAFRFPTYEKAEACAQALLGEVGVFVEGHVVSIHAETPEAVEYAAEIAQRFNGTEDGDDDTIRVIARNARMTTTGVERGIDVDFTLSIGNDTSIEGEVTLCPAADGRPTYEAWGEPDNWIDGRSLALLRKRSEYQTALNEIEAATGKVAYDLATTCEALSNRGAKQ